MNSHEPSSNSLLDPEVNLNGSWRTLTGYQPDVLQLELSQWIEGTPDDRPFFALYSPTTPHLPADDPRYDSMEVSPPRGGAFDADTLSLDAPLFSRRTPLTDEEVAKSDARYVAMAHATRSFDDAVAAVLRSLGDRADETLVIYVSDNGFLYGEHRRFGKNDAWDEATRVPMVARFPSALPAARAFSTESLVQNVDIAPTLADAAGFAWGADGHSMLPLISRQRNSIRSAALLEHCRGEVRGTLPCTGLYFEGANTDSAGYQGIVTPRYKYVEYDDGTVQLTDLRRDPQELRNLVAVAPRSIRGRTAAALRLRLNAQLSRLMSSRAQTTIATGPGFLSSRAAVFTFFSPSRFAEYRCRLVGGDPNPAWRPCPGGFATFGRSLGRFVPVRGHGDRRVRALGPDAGATDVQRQSRQGA